jgi:hypothetical protein
MPTNQYVNSFNSGLVGEQSLFEDLIIESIKMYGFDVCYLPRGIVEVDKILNEEILAQFAELHVIEMYLTQMDGFEGEDFLSKFGLQVADQCTLVVSVKRWNELVKDNLNDLEQTRPHEGDLIYLPFSKTLFEIRFVEDESPFYKLNQLPTYEMRCELFTYEGQDFATGNDDIDDIEGIYGTTLAAAITLTSGTFEVGEKITLTDPQGVVVTGELVKVDESGPDALYSFTNITYPAGEYVGLTAGSSLSGDGSGATGIVNEIIGIDDDRYPQIDVDPFDSNDDFEQKQNEILDFDEDNPFGEL